MKKFLFLVTIILALIVGIVGCGGNDSGSDTVENTTPQATTPAPESTEAATPEATTPEPEPIPDFDGYKYIIANYYHEHNWIPEPGNSYFGDLRLEHYLDIEEELNVTIEEIFIPPDEFTDRANTAAAAGTKFADQVHMNMGTLANFRQAGFLVAFDDLDVIDYTEPKWNSFYIDIARDPATGLLYGLDFLSWPGRKAFPDMGLFFNITLIEQLGVDNPYDLFDRGEWTWENFRRILLEVTEPDLNRYGISVIHDMLERAAIVSNGVNFIDNENGRLVFNMNRDATFRALEFTNQIRNIDRTHLNVGVEWGEHWYAPLQALRDHNVVFAMRDIIFMGDLRDNEHTFGMIAFPKGPDIGNSPWPMSVWNNDVQTQGIFSIGNNLEAAAYIFNRISEPFTGYEVDSWMEVARRDHFMNDARAFEIYLQMSTNAVSDGAGIFNGHVAGLIADAMRESSMNQTKTPAEAFGAINEEIQAFLDDRFN